MDTQAEEMLVRIGQHIYADYEFGVLSYDVAEESLETLDSLVGDNLWLGMPLIPEPMEVAHRNAHGNDLGVGSAEGGTV